MTQLDLGLEQARQTLAEHPTYEMALEVQILEREIEQQQNALFDWRHGAYSVRPATVADVRRVMIDDVSDVTAAEAAALGYEPWPYVKVLRQAMRNGPSMALLKHGRLIAVVGFVQRGNMVDMWFVGARPYFDGVGATLASRRLLRHIKAHFDNASLTSHTSSPHPDVERWFDVLGFRLSVRTRVGGRVFKM